MMSCPYPLRALLAQALGTAGAASISVTKTFQIEIINTEVLFLRMLRLT